MEMRIIFPVLSMMSCGVFHTATSASLREDTVTTTSLPVHHVRAKRCSCATFLDKECVYFCHLDIIWVNTPERTVSYGLGNVPRKKRSVRSFPYTTQSARCKCLGRGDSQCASFCDARDPAGHEIGADSVNRVAVGKGCAEEQSKHKPVWITRAKGKSQRPADPSVLRVSRKTLLLLGSWWSRQPPERAPGRPKTQPLRDRRPATWHPVHTDWGGLWMDPLLIRS